MILVYSGIMRGDDISGERNCLIDVDWKINKCSTTRLKGNRERALVFEINLIIEYPIGNFMNDDLSCPSCSLVLFIS